MKKFIYNAENGLNYELVGDYYYPCLKAPEPPKVGRFGLLYLDYLRSNKRTIYYGLLISNRLKEHTESIDRQAEEMFSQLVEQMAKAEGVTEELKANDQLKWVRMMNNIRNRAEEIVFNKLIFN